MLGGLVIEGNVSLSTLSLLCANALWLGCSWIGHSPTLPMLSENLPET